MPSTPTATPAGSPPAPLSAALAGRYRVERELGRGGMATVYLAEDLKHHRRVAVKVLHPELGAALGTERFLREIEVTAALQHPHILPLHDSGEAGGLLYYVMPYVEGESLRDRLRRERQLPVDDAVRIACDVAGALDYAHRRGVLHRDVKPENVLLHDGRALVADFGIARAIARAADRDTLTGTGVSVGTPAYMSPEQAAGDKELDARSDLFSLGVVLYELLAGAPPFTAPTAQGVVAKVMSETPRPLAEERRAVPAHVAAAVHRALEKLPADRFATAHDFAAALAAGPVTGLGVAAPGAPTAGGRRLTARDAAWAAAAIALGVGAYAAGTRQGDRPGTPRAEPVRFTLAIPDSQPLLGGSAGPLALSPDGKTVVYVGEAGPGRRMLFRRPLDQLAATPIAGTEGALAPFFSPDGRQVAFHVGGADGGTYRRVPVAGGTATAIANLPVSSPTYGTGAWGRGDLIVVSGNGEGLLRVPATGGTPQRLTAIDTAHGELAHRAPIFLRDGKTVAFQIVLGSRSRVGLVSVDARPAASGVVRHTTLDVPGVPVGDADGLLVLGRPDGTIVAVPADLRRGEVRGETVPLLDRVAWVVGPAASLGGDGSLVYLRGTSGSQLALVDEHGAAVGGLDEWRRYAHPRFSPDGRRIAVAVVPPEAGRRDLWVYDLPSGVFSRLTTGGLANRPAWTPDGRRVAYVTGGVVNEARPAEAWSVAADGSGPEERLYSMARDTLSIQELTFAPDGRAAVLRTSRSWPSGESDLWLLPLDGAAGGAGRRAVPLLRSPFNEAMPRVSPDGRWLAYISNESGRYEVYVRPFPGPGGRVQVSDGGGTEPVWAPDGRRLFYRTGDRFVAATLTSAPAAGAPAAGAPSLTVAGRRALFEGRYQSVVSVVAAPSYDVSPDGTRFAVLRPATENREVVVVLDWLAEVRARVAAARR